MKTFTGIVLASVMVVGTVAAQPGGQPERREGLVRRASRVSYENADLQKLERGLLASLNHEIEGVVVCAIREMVCVKLAQPGCTSGRVRDKIDDLALHGATPVIRFRAAMAAIVCDHPALFADEPWDQCGSDEELFALLALRMQEGMLAHAG